MSDSPKAFIIRDARPDEHDAIRALTLRAYEQYAALMAPSAWQGLQAAMTNALATTVPVERIVADLAGRVVGSVMLFPAAINAYQGIAAETAVPEMRLLAVDPATRGYGIGRALVEECLLRARQMGVGALGLHTSTSMHVAKALYERMGFERYPAEDFQPPGAELIMAYRFSFVPPATP
jgi:predicted N-acetyltransferase YhbS